MIDDDRDELAAHLVDAGDIQPRRCDLCGAMEMVRQCGCGGWLCATHWAEHRQHVLVTEGFDINRQEA